MNELDMLLGGLDAPSNDITSFAEPEPQAPEPPAPAPAPSFERRPQPAPQSAPVEVPSMAARLAADRLSQAAQEEESFRAPFQEEDYHLTEEQRNWLKDGNVGDVIGRLARAEINKGAERLNREYEKRLNEERARVARLEQELRQNGQQSFESQLSAQVPDLNALMQDPDFQAFLQEEAYDPTSPYPVTRSNLLARAYEARNVSYLARSVAEFRAQQSRRSAERDDGYDAGPQPSRQSAQGYSPTPRDAGQSPVAQQARLRQQMAQYQQKLDEAIRSGRIKNPKVYEEFNKAERMLREKAQQLNLTTL